MTDPLSQVIQLLRPRAVFSKGISGAGAWAVRYAEFGEPGFCAVTEGRCRLAVDGEAPVVLEEGDFVLLPATPAFTMSGFEPAPALRIDPKTAPPPDREVRYGRAEGPPDVRQFGGYFSFGSPDAELLVSLLPRMIHIRGVTRLTQLVRLVGEEAGRDEIGRDLILERLVEILLIEALRAAPMAQTRPGLLRGLADPRIAAALRGMHGDLQRPWTIPELAREAGMSRSAFFDRFVRMVGARPIEYLLSWRMAVAKNLLRDGGIALDEVADRIGYGSASTFSTAFSRHVGLPPGRFMKYGGANPITDVQP
ncbi:MAG: AraC family transcriptional regulator [Aquamicrobium sp.]|nr:AraC family transcriptional regulator [Aquamicrobium sp.]